MKITDTVKIGGITYITMRPRVVDEADRCIDGRIIYDKQKIILQEDLTGEYAEYVFLHEIIHGIFNHMNIKNEEDTVERVARGLYSVIKDNPEIFIKEDKSCSSSE